MFKDPEILQLKMFCQKVIYSPLPIDQQEHTKQDKYLWCSEWELIEILKYMFNGREAYIGDPPPNRLKHNPLWSKEEIMVMAQGIIDKYKTANEIIEYLKGAYGRNT